MAVKLPSKMCSIFTGLEGENQYYLCSLLSMQSHMESMRWKAV